MPFRSHLLCIVMLSERHTHKRLCRRPADYELLPASIAHLYDWRKQQCVVCGLRLWPNPLKRHMDEHFKQRSEAMSGKRQSREWFPRNAWQSSQQPAACDSKKSCVIVDEDETACALCEEELVALWDDELDAWVVPGGQRVEDKSSAHFNKLVHTTCM